jgi:hypothetical protein
MKLPLRREAPDINNNNINNLQELSEFSSKFSTLLEVRLILFV